MFHKILLRHQSSQQKLHCCWSNHVSLGTGRPQTLQPLAVLLWFVSKIRPVLFQFVPLLLFGSSLPPPVSLTGLIRILQPSSTRKREESFVEQIQCFAFWHWPQLVFCSFLVKENKISRYEPNRSPGLTIHKDQISSPTTIES